MSKNLYWSLYSVLISVCLLITLFSSISIFRSVAATNQILRDELLLSDPLPETFSDSVNRFVEEHGELPGGFISAQQRFVTQDEMATIRAARNAATTELERLHKEGYNIDGAETDAGLTVRKIDSDGYAILGVRVYINGVIEVLADRRQLWVYGDGSREWLSETTHPPLTNDFDEWVLYFLCRYQRHFL